MILQALEHKCQIECPATQDAIDWMGQQAFMDRRQLFAYLKKGFENPSGLDADDVFSFIMTAWTNNKKMKLATGRTRDEWISIS